MDTADLVMEPLVGHSQAVTAVAYSPDGTRIVTASRDGSVRIWDGSTGVLLLEPLHGHSGPVISLAITPDGRRLMTGGNDQTSMLWDMASGDLVGDLGPQPGKVWAVSVTPDGSCLLTGGRDRTVHFWDAQTLEPLGDVFSDRDGPITSISISVDGSWFVTGSNDGRACIWQLGAEGAVRPTLLASPRSDEPTSTDRLGVKGEAFRLAEIMAARSTPAPLAIALLGDWGAGKSSFALQIRDGISRISNYPRRRSGSQFVSSVCQVSFNAWHYSDETIWSGLIEHLFNALSGESDRIADPSTVAQRQEAVANKLSEAHAERDGIIRRLGEQQDYGSWYDSPAAAWRVAKAFTWASLQDLRRVLVRIVIPWLLIIAFGLVVYQLLSPLIESIWAALAGMAAPVIAYFSLLRRTGEKAKAVLDAQRAKLRARIRELDEEIVVLNRERMTLGAETRLSELIQQVSQGDDYSRYRGVLGQAHEHLRSLSDGLRAARQEWSSRDEPLTDPPLERIILYIDDLDRCPPSRVMEVLSVVHLLLALDLFVVVVAVDSRWLERSLQTHDRNTFGEDPESHQFSWESSNPLDFLDKIFQIPYGLRPMTSVGASTLLNDILPVQPESLDDGRPLLAEDEAERRLEPVADAVTPQQARELPASTSTPTRTIPDGRSGDQGGNGRPQRDSDNRSDAQENLAVALPQPIAGSPSVASLEITSSERDFLSTLGPILRTPRAVKKFANIYRLVRVGVSDIALERFLGDRVTGPFQGTALLLSLIVGRAEFATPALRKVLEAAVGQDPLAVISAAYPDGESGWRDVRRVLDDLGARGAPMFRDLETYRNQAIELSRYSFHTQSIWREFAPRLEYPLIDNI